MLTRNDTIVQRIFRVISFLGRHNQDNKSNNENR